MRINSIILLLAVLLAVCNDSIADHFEDPVGALIDKLTASHAEQEDSISRLLAMGEDVVPCLINYLDDVRPVARQAVSFENKSMNSFEAFRHYRPEVVHDLVAAILNQITGKSFIFVYNGASEEARAENAALWASWCQVHCNCSSGK